MDYCRAVELEFPTRHRLRHSRKPIVTRFQHLTATHATDIGDFVTTVTQRVTVARSNYNFELSSVSAVADHPLLYTFSSLFYCSDGGHGLS